MQGGYDADSVIKSWNESSAKSDRLVGSKFQTVTNLMKLPSECLDKLRWMVNKVGWASFLARCVTLHAASSQAPCSLLQLR